MIGTWKLGEFVQAGHQEYKESRTSKEKNLVKGIPGIDEEVVRNYI